MLMILVGYMPNICIRVFHNFESAYLTWPPLSLSLSNDCFMQFVIWFVIPATRSPQANHNNNALALIVLLQYVPRLYLIFPLSTQIIKATGVVTKTAWAGAAYNLLLYMLASHVCCSKLPFYPPWLQRCKLSPTLFLLLGFRGIMVFAFS